MSETDIQNRIRIRLSEYGIVLRLNVGQFVTLDGRPISGGLPPGTPDLLFAGQNFISFIEVKTQTGRISPEQQNFMKRLRDLGHIAEVARSVEDALRIIGR